MRISTKTRRLRTFLDTVAKMMILLIKKRYVLEILTVCRKHHVLLKILKEMFLLKLLKEHSGL